MRLRCVILSTLASLVLYGQEATFRSDTRLVVLNVSVFDQDGKIVRDLPKSAFTVYENGEKQILTVFRQEDVPISLGLIVDTSASMTDKRDRVASAALSMVKASNPQDEVFIINFNESAVLAKEFTSDIKDLEKALRNLDPKGETAMRDALRLGIEHLRQHAHRDKKVLLVVTDGEDNSSVETQAHLVQVAQQNDVIIYAVGLLGAEEPESAARARKQLNELTQETGGRSWFPNDVAEIANITPGMAHKIRNQCILAYPPTNLAADGSFRKIRVDVDVPGVLVRTRAGYYAPKKDRPPGLSNLRELVKDPSRRSPEPVVLGHVALQLYPKSDVLRNVIKRTRTGVAGQIVVAPVDGRGGAEAARIGARRQTQESRPQPDVRYPVALVGKSDFESAVDVQQTRRVQALASKVRAVGECIAGKRRI